MLVNPPTDIQKHFLLHCLYLQTLFLCSIMHVQNEQQKLLKTHSSTFHFISQYFYVYDIQKYVPCKIFLCSIQSAESLGLTFFQELFTIIETKKHPFETLKHYDNLFVEIQKYEYIDVETYGLLKNMYLKAVKYYLANVEPTEYEVLDFYVKNYDLLVFVVKELTKEMSIKMNRPHILRAELLHYKNIVEQMLKNEKYSVFIDFIEVKDECRKIELFDDVLVAFISHVKNYISQMEPEEGYLKCMEFTSEIVLNKVTCNKMIIEDLKNFST